MSELVIGLMNHLSCCCVLGRRRIQALAFMGLCRGAPWPPTWPWALSWCRVIPGAEYLWVCPWSFLLQFFPRWPYPNPSSSTRNQKVISFSSIPRKESFLRMKLCLQIFARGIVAAHIIFSLWNRKLREAHSLLLFAALPEASLEAASWLDPGTTVSHNISVFQNYRTEVLRMWALCSYPKSPCVIFTSVFPPSDTCCGNWEQICSPDWGFPEEPVGI